MSEKVPLDHSLNQTDTETPLVEADTRLPLESSEKSELAATLERVKSATLEAYAKRERVPQPLFWSLFHSEIDKLKKKKHERRILDEVLGKLG